jgi:hypothetical protein
LGRCHLDPLHDAERLGHLQRVAEPALHVSPLDDPGRVAGRWDRLAHQRHVGAVRGWKRLPALWLLQRAFSPRHPPVRTVDQLNRDRPKRDFILKIGVHRGASIAVTLNERLDYFGQTVNIAARVQSLADGDEICITEDVHDAEGVAEIMGPYTVVKAEVGLKGVSNAKSIYRWTR